MKAIYIIFVMALFLTSTSQAASPWGLGVILNNPTGFSIKNRLSSRNSFDGAIGYSFGGSDYLSIHGTYLWEFQRGIPVDGRYIGYYFGVGGSLHSHDNDNDPPFWRERDRSSLGLALRGSGGLNYYFSDPNIEIFAELALNFFFVPATDADLDIALGVRFYFL